MQTILAGQGAIFVEGNPAFNAILSEPPMHDKRLFLSIVPGAFAQIDQWRRRNQ